MHHDVTGGWLIKYRCAGYRHVMGPMHPVSMRFFPANYLGNGVSLMLGINEYNLSQDRLSTF